MNILSVAFNTLLYRPLFNILILFYEYLPGNDFGVAIIALTCLLRLILYPLMAQNIRNQKALTEMQPKLKEIQKDFKEDPEKQAQEIMNLYKEKNISPFSAFVPLLIQLPLLIALFQVFQRGLDPSHMNSLYGFVPSPGIIDYTFLGILSLTESSTILAVISAALQFIQFKTLKIDTGVQKKQEKGVSGVIEMTQKQMPYFLSGFTFVFLLRLPAALALYWITTSLFSIAQQYILQKND